MSSDPNAKSDFPVLTTPRLLLRPFTLSDALAVHEFVGAPEVAAMSASMPHPFQPGMVEQWVAMQQPMFERGDGVVWAITLRADQTLCGAINLLVEPDHQIAEIGYWIGLPYWNRGYATEATHAAIRYGFETLALHRIYATHLGRNPASGRVMQKAGMRYEGRLRGHFLKWGVHEDVLYYGILRDEWQAGAGD